MLTPTDERATNPLIPTARLLDPQTPTSTHPTTTVSLALGFGRPESAFVVAVVWVIAPGATAHAEQPEERRGPGEGDGEPGDG